MTKRHPSCQTCRAYVERAGYAPYCSLATHHGGIGCLKLSRPVQIQPEHTGEVERKPVKAKKKAKRT